MIVKGDSIKSNNKNRSPVGGILTARFIHSNDNENVLEVGSAMYDFTLESIHLRCAIVYLISTNRTASGEKGRAPGSWKITVTISFPM